MKHLKTLRICFFIALATFSSCEDDDGNKPGLRSKIDYTTLTPETTYGELFIDANGDPTVDLSEGNIRLKMFQALNHYLVSSVAAGSGINATLLNNMFSNNGNPFTDISTTTLSISGAELNSSGLQLRDVTGSSLEEADARVVRETMEGYFTAISLASESMAVTAAPGQAGKLGDFLLDPRGLALSEQIRTALTGALQLDYIGNVLLDEGLDADNTTVVAGSNYTALEHNWDIAYGLLTLNPVYLAGATDSNSGTPEFGAGHYLWQHNKVSYRKMYAAFLKGRAAIVNNDTDQYRALATFIRTELEKALSNAALTSLAKWKTTGDAPGRAQAMGEAAGFIYALRFAQLHEGSALYSNTLLENLLGTANGFWDLSESKINAAMAAIAAKFEN